jgi:hypothetical protein
MAIYYYATGTSFQRVEDVPLKEAIKTRRPDDNLLQNRGQQASTLLDSYHNYLRVKVAERMNGAVDWSHYGVIVIAGVSGNNGLARFRLNVVRDGARAVLGAILKSL